MVHGENLNICLLDFGHDSFLIINGTFPRIQPRPPLFSLFKISKHFVIVTTTREFIYQTAADFAQILSL